jgi:ABC-type bacteriocin/lantibiotic exporter with double-glycine peptidase domain
MDTIEHATGLDREIEQVATKRARERTNIEKWNRNVSALAFSILIVVIVLVYNEVSMVVVAPVAVLGLIAIWATGWMQGKRLYLQIYREELSKLQQEVMKTAEGTKEEAIEGKIREAMRDMFR